MMKMFTANIFRFWITDEQDAKCILDIPAGGESEDKEGATF
jgi:hypothetical protein